jgi:hypothetical protein
MNRNILKNSNIIVNIIKNILRRNTNVNFYVKNDINNRIYSNFIVLFSNEFKYPFKAQTFHRRGKFDGNCQYNIEFNVFQSNNERVEIKRHYNFSQNYLRISFYLKNDYDLNYIYKNIFYNKLKLFIVKREYEIIH